MLTMKKKPSITKLFATLIQTSNRNIKILSALANSHKYNGSCIAEEGINQGRRHTMDQAPSVNRQMGELFIAPQKKCRKNISSGIGC